MGKCKLRFGLKKKDVYLKNFKKNRYTFLVIHDNDHIHNTDAFSNAEREL